MKSTGGGGGEMNSNEWKGGEKENGRKEVGIAGEGMKVRKCWKRGMKKKGRREGEWMKRGMNEK